MRPHLSVVLCVALSLLYHGAQAAAKPNVSPQENQLPIDPAGDVAQVDTRRANNKDIKQALRVLQEAYEAITPSVRVWPSQCYACVNCPEVRNSTRLKTCPEANPRCVVYAETYSFQKNPVYIRGCVEDRGTCEAIKKVHYELEGIKLLSCSECEGDRCNSSIKTTSVPGVLLFLIITPLLKKLALS